MVGIYKIISPSGKVYIGQSWNIEKRFKDYLKKGHNKKQRKLYSSFLKYGAENHKFEIIYELPIDIEQSILDAYEILYISQYKSCSIELLNIALGGSRGKHSEESKNIIRIKAKFRKRKKHTKITKLKMSISAIGHKRNVGQVRSKEHIKKLNDSIIRKILQYSLNNEFLKEWSSIKQASFNLNISSGNICSCAKGNLNKSGGYIWKYKN